MAGLVDMRKALPVSDSCDDEIQILKTAGALSTGGVPVYLQVLLIVWKIKRAT